MRCRRRLPIAPEQRSVPSGQSRHARRRHRVNAVSAAGLVASSRRRFTHFDHPSDMSSADYDTIQHDVVARALANPLKFTGNYSASSNNIKLVHWPLMGGLLHLVQRCGDWAGPQPAQAPPRCTKCNSPPINGQCTNHRIAV